jgi:hypothetical protein
VLFEGYLEIFGGIEETTDRSGITVRAREADGLVAPALAPVDLLFMLGC